MNREAHLQAIANAQDRNAKIEDMRINMRCIVIVYRVRRPREDNSYESFETSEHELSLQGRVTIAFGLPG